MSLITILLTLAIFGLVLYALMQVPMPAPFKNILLGIAILLIVWWAVQKFGLDMRI